MQARRPDIAMNAVVNAAGSTRTRSGRRLAGAVAGSGTIYGLALLALLLGEINFARVAAPADYGAYQLVRQGLPVVVGVSLLGFDVALARELSTTNAAARFGVRYWRLVCGTAIASTAFAALSWKFMSMPPRVALTCILAAPALAITSLISANMRACGRHAAAATIFHGYRLALGLVLIAAATRLDALSATIVLTVTVLIFALAGMTWLGRQSGKAVFTREEHKRLRILGLGFAMSLVTMAASDWLDIALIALADDGLEVQGEYAATKLLAVYPLLSLGSVLGFVSLPELARRRDKLTRSFVRRLTGWTVGGTLFASCLWAALSNPVHALTYERPTPVLLVLVLAAVGGLRLYYVLPSSLLGAVGTGRDVARLGGVGVLALGVQALITILFEPWGLALAAALGLLINTLTRVVGGSILAADVLRKYRGHATGVGTG